MLLDAFSVNLLLLSSPVFTRETRIALLEQDMIYFGHKTKAVAIARPHAVRKAYTRDAARSIDLQPQRITPTLHSRPYPSLIFLYRPTKSEITYLSPTSTNRDQHSCRETSQSIRTQRQNNPSLDLKV